MIASRCKSHYKPTLWFLVPHMCAIVFAVQFCSAKKIRLSFCFVLLCTSVVAGLQ